MRTTWLDGKRMGQCAALCAGMALVACGGSGDPPAAGTPRLAAGTVAAASGGGRAATALPSSYILTRIGEGWIQDGRSLNDSGQVAGSYYPPGSERPHAFLFDGMTQRDLGTLENGAGASLASGINAAGQVTGFATRGETIRAFLYDGAAMKDLGTLSGSDQRAWSNGLAINDAGMVTGYAFNGVTNHAFVSDGSVMTDLGTLGNADSWSHGNDINASGQVTGDAHNGIETHPFLHDGTAMKDLGILPGGAGWAQGSFINASGQVAGYSPTARGNTHAFLYDGGAMKDLGTLSGGDGVSMPLGLNDAGQVVGNATMGTEIHAFLYDGTAMRDLGTLAGGRGYSSARAINAGGQVVGESRFEGAGAPPNDVRAFIWSAAEGRMADLNERLADPPAGLVLRSAAAISDSGHIVAESPQGLFLLTPAELAAAGLVTGGGWIASPAGAFRADATLSGRASFSLSVRPGAGQGGPDGPDGHASFVFQAGSFRFRSTEIDSLWIRAPRAEYGGAGTVNGEAGYRFLMTVIDGQGAGRSRSDRIRMRIWHQDPATQQEVVDYDSSIGLAAPATEGEGSDPEGILLGGGNVRIHSRR